MKLAALISGGKDSLYAAYLASKEHELSCFIAIKSKNPESYMFHVPNIDLVKLQAKSARIPLIFKTTKGEKEKELKDLKIAIKEAKKKYKIKGIVSGALFSKYQRSRIDKLAEELKLESLSPLWKKVPQEQWKEMFKEKFKVIISAVAAGGLGPEWLGKEINRKTFNQLLNLHNTCYVCTGGEGGEFETLVLDCPLFNEKLKIISSKKHWDGQAGYLAAKAKLIPKS